jgi:hypothetical protein
MANTTNYYFNKPTVGGSQNSWGGDLNENWDKIDKLLHGATFTDTDSNTVEKIQPDLDKDNWAINGTAVTASAAELNKLDGASVTTSQLNVLGALTASAAELNKLDSCTTSTAELNHVTGVTSAIQTQLDNLLTNITTIDFGDWTITETSGVLYFATGGTNKMKLDASGNLTITGSLNSNGTI